MSLTVVIGGTRSGKSARAERLAATTGLPVRYVATADAADPAMRARIDAHVARRPAAWTTAQAGPQLADAFGEGGDRCVLLDGLGVWIAAALHRAGAFEPAAADVLVRVRDDVLRHVDRAVDAAVRCRAAIVVAEQAGEGLLPPDPASRTWLDLLGEATQRFAARAGRVELVVAGRALALGADNGRAAAHDASHAGLRHHGDRDVLPGDADHAVNIVAGGPPAWLREALQRALDGDVERYPDDRDATAAIAALHGREPDEVVACNGAAEALWLLPAALRPRLAACVHPGFTESEAALRAHRVPVVRVLRDPERGFALDPDAIPDSADLVIVGNPASPSGTLDPAHALLAVRRPGRVVVVDEAFMDLVPGEPGSLVRERLDDVVVVRSLTKALAIPGLRAGYAVAPAPLAVRLRAVRPPWSANALALAALAATARRPQALAAIAERVAAERDDLAQRLGGIVGLRSWPSAANFCLVEVADGPALVAALRERSIAVRPAASFPGLGPQHIRLTARDPSSNARLVAAVEEALVPAAESSARFPGARSAPDGRWRPPPCHQHEGGTPSTVRSRPGIREFRTELPAAGTSSMITVVGIGADGWRGLAAAERAAILAADEIIGSTRQLALLPAATGAVLRAWPSPLDPLLDELVARTNGSTCVLASGDPMLHGIGATLARRLGPRRLQVHPHPSAFSFACARLGWPAADVELVSTVTRAPESVARVLQAGRRIVVYAIGSGGAAAVAAVLCSRGYGPSRFVVLEQLGGPAEALVDSTAEDWGERTADPLHAIAIECRPAAGTRALPRTPGLPDDAYAGDGQLTKRHVRALTIAALAPLPGQLLWDVGAASGSIAIEWLRAEPCARAIAIESRPDRAEQAVANALRLGVPELDVRSARAPEALGGLPAPDAVFVGGGVTTAGLVDACWQALKDGGRIVANAVTIEGEQALAAARAAHGGELARIEIAHAEPLGAFMSWGSQRPVVQWTAVKG